MNPHDYAEEKHISTRRVLDFTLLTNPLGPSSRARTAIRKVVRDTGVFPDEKARYLSRYLSRREGIEEESFLFGSGSSRILSLYLRASGTEKIVIPWPCNPYRVTFLEQVGIQVERLPIKDEAGDFTVDQRSLMTCAEGGKAIFLMNPGDPFGTTIPAERIRELVTAAEKSGGMLVVDEALIDYTGLPSVAGEAVRSACCLVLRSFSLFHALAGLRIGYGIAHPSLISRLRAFAGPDPVNTLALAAARASLGDAPYRKRTIDYIAGEKAYFFGKLKSLPGLVAHDTPCGSILLSLEKQRGDLADWFLKRNILVYSFTDGRGRTWMRLPMRRRPQNARFLRTLRYLLSTATELP